MINTDDSCNEVTLFYTSLKERLELLEEGLVALILQLSNEGWSIGGAIDLTEYLKKLEIVRYMKGL